jgi:hypothetical protein
MVNVLSIIGAINPIYFIMLFIIGVIIGIKSGKKIFGEEGGNMFGRHEHKWNYMHSNDAGWDWFFCNECLAECCQNINVNTGVVERHTFNVQKKGGK